MNDTVLKMAKAHLAKASGEQQLIDLVQGINCDYSTIFQIVKAFNGAPGATEKGFFCLVEAAKRNCPDYVSADGEFCCLKPGFACWLEGLEGMLKILWDSSENQKYGDELRGLYRFIFEKYMRLKDEKCKFIDLLFGIYRNRQALGDLESFGLTDEVMKELEEKSGDSTVLFMIDLFRQVKSEQVKFANNSEVNEWKAKWKESYLSKYPFRKQPW
ncbi:MAG: hypothetical protein WCF94_03600 [bacterium]